MTALSPDVIETCARAISATSVASIGVYLCLISPQDHADSRRRRLTGAGLFGIALVLTASGLGELGVLLIATAGILRIAVMAWPNSWERPEQSVETLRLPRRPAAVVPDRSGPKSYSRLDNRLRTQRDFPVVTTTSLAPAPDATPSVWCR